MAEALRKARLRHAYSHTKLLRITTISLLHFGDQVFLSKDAFSLAHNLGLSVSLFAIFLTAALTLVLVGCYLQA